MPIPGHKIANSKHFSSHPSDNYTTDNVQKSVNNQFFVYLETHKEKGVTNTTYQYLMFFVWQTSSLFVLSTDNYLSGPSLIITISQHKTTLC